MKKYPVSIQLYSVREDAKKDFVSVLKKIASFGYPGVEFAGLHGMNPKEVRKIIDDLGMKASSAHGPMPDRNNANEIIDTAKTLGYTCHISGRGKDQFLDKAGTEKSGEDFLNACEALKGSGISFGIHNHWWEFDKRFDGRLAMDVALARAPEAVCEVDTYWVKVGGEDPATVITDLGKRVRFLHIKDGPLDRDKNMTAVGKGKMSWKPILTAAQSCPVEWIVVELDRCDTDMLTAVHESIQYLVDQGFGIGK